MKIPCLKKKGLKLFSPTADQRHSLGEDVFLRTHYPQTYRRFRGSELVEQWPEEKVLERLIDNDSNIGNRVFVLFGAAGSGKSETLRWIEHNLKKKSGKKRIFRISRTELDPVNILASLVNETGDHLDKAIKEKWVSLKEKPVSLANALVWDTLNTMLSSDETIIPLSYKIRPLVENSLRRSFCRDNLNDVYGKVDIISLEEWEEVKRTCAVEFGVTYEQFRKRLIDKFEAEVLGGYDFIKTLEEVGDKLFRSTGYRPVLLIDDLVQSMSIYASDLLDYFITLEEGNWDVLIGVTPASFETSKRGREILNRINYLDTFDDRIYKLWLTDEQGHESYTVNSINVGEYIKKYLLEYKRMNGYICSNECSHYQGCLGLHWGKDEDIGLTPINAPLLERFYDNLFKGKGKPRHILVTVEEYLMAIMGGDEVNFLNGRIKREKSCNHDNLRHKVLIEAYLPLDAGGVIQPTHNFYKTLGCKAINKGFLNITDLKEITPTARLANLAYYEGSQPNPELAALRDWLELKRPNKELLRKFRLSCYAFIHEFWSKNSMVRSNTSRFQGVIRCDQYFEGCRLPLKLEGVDDFEGISINRSIGMDAYLLLRLKEQDPEEQTNSLNNLLSKIEVNGLIWLAKEKSGQLEKELGAALSRPISELAFMLYVFAFYISLPTRYPLILEEQYHKGSLEQFLSGWETQFKRPGVEMFSAIEDLFKDWFQLRDNLYDAFLLRGYMEKYPDIYSVLENLIETIDTLSIPVVYKVGEKTLKEFLNEVLYYANSLLSILVNADFINDYKVLFIDFMDFSSLEASDYSFIEDRIKAINDKCSEIGTSISIPLFFRQEINKSNSDCTDFFTMITHLHKELGTSSFSSYRNLKKQLESICLECDKKLEGFSADPKIFGITIPSGIVERQGIDLKSLLKTTIEKLEKTIFFLARFESYKQVKTLLEISFIDSIKDICCFLDNFSPYFKGNKQDLEKLYYLKELSRKYLDLASSENDLDSLLDNIGLLLEVNVNLNYEKVQLLKVEVCNNIKNQIVYSNIFFTKQEYRDEIEIIVSLLNRLGKENLNNYNELLIQLKQWKYSFEEKVTALTSKMHHSSRIKLEQILFGNTEKILTHEYLILKELNEKIPVLASRLNFEINLNLYHGDKDEW